MATRRPTRPRSTSTRPTVRNYRSSSPRAVSSRPQPTTGRGRVVRGPANPFVSRGTLAGLMGQQAPRGATGAVSAGGVPSSQVAAPQYSLANLPVDASYDQAIALLQRQRDEGIAAITGERARTLSDYGFQEGANGALTFDPNNPLSKASVMKKTYDTNRRSTAQSLGAGGQLYSGAFQNAQDLINRNQIGSEDALTKNLQAFLARNTGQVKDAGTQYELAAGQAYGDRVGRFQSNPNYDPATGALLAPAGGSSPAAAGGVPAAKPATAASIAAALRRRARMSGARIGRI